MKSHTITRRLEFDAGHRVYQHESKCNHVHGHRYVVEVECAGDLDKLGRVVDFSVIKSKFGKWIDENLDHGMILFKDDPLAPYWKSGFARYGRPDEPFEQQKHFIMDKNPTAENLAGLLYKKANEILANDGVKVTAMTVWETPNCRATYSE
jgi:6-pyruvoyltetrahydropterin/6-carboxytetrahydropterin synthase